MVSKRVLVGYGIDVDAVAIHINTKTGAPASLSNVSRGVFGATIGVRRLLKLWEQKNIKCSWFIPCHTIETFPDDIALIRDSGHEIGLHGYTHEHFDMLSREQQEAILTKTIEIQTRFLGHKPKGFTAPAWANSPDMIELLENHGIEYDHSFMHDDFHPYYVSKGTEEVVTTNYDFHPETWMTPMKAAPKSSIVEIPASWALDDYPPFQYDLTRPGSQGYVDPYNVERQWKEQFEYCYKNYEKFVFPVSIHPQVSGRPHILRMHERFIDWVNTHEGVEWCTFGQMADEFRAGRI